MSVKKTTVIAALIALAISSSLSAFALTLEEVKASQCANIETVLQDKHAEAQLPLNPKTSAEFGIPSITFKEVNASKGVMVVFAWAKWCRPCINNIKYMKEIQHDFAGRIKVRAYDVDLRDTDSPAFESIPAALVYRNGSLAAIYTLLPDSVVFVKGAINQLLKNAPVLDEGTDPKLAGQDNLYKIPFMDDPIYRVEKEKSTLTVVYAYRPAKEHKGLTNFMIKLAAKYPDLGFFKYDLTKNSTLNHDFGHKFKWDYGVVLMKGGKIVNFIPSAPGISLNLEQMINMEK